SLYPVLFLALLSTLGCDEDIEILSADQAATHGDVEFRMGKYSIQYLELSDEQGETFSYPDPVLVVPLTITNRGDDKINYQPAHNARQMSESETPLLYPSPPVTEDGIDWESFKRRPITGVNLGRGKLESQIQSPKSLAPGEEITDIY